MKTEVLEKKTKNPEKEKGGKTTMRILSRSAGYGGHNAQIYDCFSFGISL